MHRSFNAISKSLLTPIFSKLDFPVCDTFLDDTVPNLIDLGKDHHLSGPRMSSLCTVKYLIELKNEGFKNLEPCLSQTEKTGLMEAFKSGHIHRPKSERDPSRNLNSGRRAMSDHATAHTLFLSLNPPLGKRGYDSGGTTSDALALVLYAVNSCTRDQAGFDPNLFSSPTADTVVEEARDGPDLLASQMVGLGFNFTSRAVDDRDSKGNRQNQSCDRGQDDVDDSLNPVIEEHKERRIQGSTVEPSSCFRISEFIRKPDELIGRATAVYKAHWSLSNDEEPCALKFSWPLKSRTFEIDILKHLKGVLPSSSHDHFPHIFFSQTWTADQMKIPALSLNLSLAQRTVLCALAAKYYNKLWQAGSVENFKLVWLDCVEVSYLACKIGGILHRDISENNLMVLPLHDGKAKGILNDWDVAQFFDKEHNDSSSRRHQIGTPPFMAIDLLPLSTDGLKSPMREPAMERKGTKDPEPHALVQSWTRDSDQNAMAKRAMLSPIILQGYPELLCKSLKPSFRKSELAQWIESLRKLLSGARIRYEFAVQGGEESDARTYGGRLTFKKFMGAIGVAPRTWGIAGYLDDEYSV
ncbi:hypothetical protein FA13DRAFT_1816257 [Coprinellus micaceus]|uniref:Fungal-type protein kinase domain-containing protein n=1 Tax=Coprinellus micaceus TaxID=71717 RepID=A0A4Y7T048_COPMI|nr:hypothetical protein FA13DRAFT_1816257 [Coprinellus micaceus]